MTETQDAGLKREAYVRHKRGHDVTDIATALGKQLAWVRAAIADKTVQQEVMEARDFYPFPEDCIDRGLQLMRPVPPRGRKDIRTGY